MGETRQLAPEMMRLQRVCKRPAAAADGAQEMEIRMRKFEASSVASDATVVFFGKSGSGKTYLVPRGRRGRSAVSCY
jgi:hypothetical protein